MSSLPTGGGFGGSAMVPSPRATGPASDVQRGSSNLSVLTPEPMLELRDIRAGYGAIEVLHGVNLSVPAGGVLAVLGPNGAGKSTMLRLVCGLHEPTAGDLMLGGRRVNGVDPVALARAGLCTIPEGRGVFPNLTVRENLQMVTYRGMSRKSVEERAFSYFPRLSERRTQFAGTMSGGEQQMLAVARAIASDPSVLLLDELSMGLAPLIVDQLYEAVRAISADGVTILVVEQFAAAVLDVADTAAVMVNGRVVLTGTPAEVESDLSSVYLGGETPAHIPTSENPLVDLSSDPLADPDSTQR
jgi:branched-chain amino acid transport system ATP-binding protein